MLSFVIILTKIEHGYKIYYGILLDRGHTKMCLWCVCGGGGGTAKTRFRKKLVPVRSRCFERSEGSMGSPGPYATSLAESF